MKLPRPLPAVAMAAAAVCGTLAAAAPAAAQGNKMAPSRVAVIDMGEVFAQYDRFEDERKQIESAIEADSAKAKQVAEQMKKIQATLQSGTYKQDSEEYLNLVAQINKLQTDLKVEQAKIGQKYMKKEADTYKEIYAEVTAAVKLYSEYRGYSMVIRSEQAKVEDAEAAGDILQGMNKLVVYTAPGDDITDSIVKYLDGQYSKKTGKPPRDQRAEAAKKAAARTAAAGQQPRG